MWRLHNILEYPFPSARVFLPASLDKMLVLRFQSIAELSLNKTVISHVFCTLMCRHSKISLALISSWWETILCNMKWNMGSAQET